MEKKLDANKMDFLNMSVVDVLQIIAETGGDTLEAVINIDPETEFKLIIKIEEV
ncbi:hypothetical protein HZZ02_08380 [Streptococcus danieliae]|nr:hypothetical protein [Streptococcus danieliae]